MPEPGHYDTVFYPRALVTTRARSHRGPINARGDSRHGRLPTRAGRFVERQLPSKLAPEEQEIDAGLKEDTGNRQVPNIPDLKPRHAREQCGRQGKEKQPCHRANQRRQGVANPLENAGRGEDNSHGHEIQRDDS
jgi:hypothetical protein